MEECGIVRGEDLRWGESTVVCTCKMIPIAAVAVAIAIRSDYWFSKLKEGRTPA